MVPFPSSLAPYVCISTLPSRSTDAFFLSIDVFWFVVYCSIQFVLHSTTCRVSRHHGEAAARKYFGPIPRIVFGW
jgi:hypothetical protein